MGSTDDRHTGEGALGGDNYSGIDVNRAARVAAAAAGGQVIVTDATRMLVERQAPAGVTLRDLGVHRLRDLNLPMRLHDLVVAGLPADFPAPRTLDARPGNLPAQLSSFVGREDETAEAVRLLGRARLLTLTGAGGTGKSRLALHVAGRLRPGCRDGAFFADLSTVTDPELVPSVLARALGVPEAPGRPVLEALCAHLRDRQLLLVVDNFEQVAAAGPVIEELLATAPEVRVLVTSRAAFALRSEQELVVPPLDLPDPRRPPDLDALGRSEAVRLFVERPGGPAGVPADHPERPGGGRDRRPARRAAPGHRAGRHPHQDPGPRADPAPPAAAPHAADHRGRDPPGPAADPARGHRLEPRPAPGPRAATVRPAVGVRRRLDLRGRRGGMRPHRARAGRPRRPDLAGRPVAGAPDRAHGRPPPVLDAGDDPRVRAGAAGRRRRPGAGQPARRAAVGGRRRPGRPGPGGGGGAVAVLAAARAPHRGPTPARAKALAGAGGIAWWQEDLAAAARFYEEALAIERRLGDPARTADALYNQAFVVAAEGDFEGAFRLFEESLELFRRAGTRLGRPGPTG